MGHDTPESGCISLASDGPETAPQSQASASENHPAAARNEGVPGSSPGVGFCGLQGFPDSRSARALLGT